MKAGEYERKLFRAEGWAILARLVSSVCAALALLWALFISFSVVMGWAVITWK